MYISEEVKEPKALVPMDSKIRKILNNFIKDDITLDEFTSPKTMSYWRRSLTHESVNYLDNYEKYEFLGDAGLGYAFSIYLREDLGINEAGTLNNMATYYMSKSYQPIIARKIGLQDLVISSPDVKITDDILEDVFESFFGVIEMLSRHFKSEHASVYILNFFRWYFSELDTIDLSKGEQINKALFDYLYYFLSRESTGGRYSAGYDNTNKSFRFNSQFITSLSYYNSDVAKEIRRILTYKGGPDEKYYIDKVIETLKAADIDLDWYKREQEKAKFSPEIQELAKANGFSRFFLYVNEKGSYDLVAQKTDPKTRKSITELLYSFDTDDFIWLKSKSVEIIREKYS